MRISRSKIELFRECPRCFWLDKVQNVKRPDGPGFSLNNAVDELLKREFDGYRERRERHPLMAHAGIDAVPFAHHELDAWRDSLRRGVEHYHADTNLTLCGGIDDVWVNRKGQLHVVDYKATSTVKEISLEDEYKQAYKRQAEIYQWLFRRRGFDVSPTAYFVFANGVKDHDEFDGRLEFEMTIIPYEGDDSWVEPVIYDIRTTLDSELAPSHSSSCKFCLYRTAVDVALQTVE